jgi:hypothetical protein
LLPLSGLFFLSIPGAVPAQHNRSHTVFENVEKAGNDQSADYSDYTDEKKVFGL